MKQELFSHLQSFHSDGLLRKVMPEKVESDLIEQGYINSVRGGHVLTEKAWKILYPKKTTK